VVLRWREGAGGPDGARLREPAPVIIGMVAIGAEGVELMVVLPQSKIGQ
jgi:hypothetical protein